MKLTCHSLFIKPKLLLKNITYNETGTALLRPHAQYETDLFANGKYSTIN